MRLRSKVKSLRDEEKEQGNKKALFGIRVDGETLDSINNTNIEHKEKNKVETNSLHGRQHLQLESGRGTERDSKGK